MNNNGLRISLIVTILLLAFASWIILFFHSSAGIPRSPGEPVAATAGGENPTGEAPLAVPFNPPNLEDAPENIRESVLLGYKIMTDTQKYAKQYVGNGLACTNCHFDGGRSMNTISLVGVGAVYPRYRARRDYSADLTLRTQGCFERSMNGVAPDNNSQVMQSLLAYYQWISKGVPIYSDVPWLHLPHDLGLKRDPNPAAGKAVYADVCARCHGDDGHGTDIAPALWGDGAYNDGAGMHRVRTLSVFAWRFMPKSGPILSKEQALDVAGFVHDQPRPKFAATHPNKIERTISLPAGEQP